MPKAIRSGERKLIYKLLEYCEQEKVSGQLTINVNKVQERVAAMTDLSCIYEIDAIAKENGHDILRNPPYNCDLKPIELIWRVAKKKNSIKNVNIEKRLLPSIIEQEFLSISSDEWKKECDHVVNVENQYIERDRITKDLPEFVIQVGNSSSDDSDESTILFRDSMTGVEYLESDFN